MILIGLLGQLFFAVFFFFLCIAFLTGAPYVPSTKKTSKAMIDLSDMKNGDTVYDLGSGDGRLLFLAAKKGATKIVGLEINPWLVLFTNIRILFSPYRNQISCKWQNFWTMDVGDADIVFVYLLPWKMDKLGAKLKKELKPGTTVVSNSFIFPKWKMKTKDELNHVYVSTI